jgi:hypothetical protein
MRRGRPERVEGAAGSQHRVTRANETPRPETADCRGMGWMGGELLRLEADESGAAGWAARGRAAPLQQRLRLRSVLAVMKRNEWPS